MISSASLKRETTHAAMPDSPHELKLVCYTFDAGGLGYDGMMRALLDRRVLRRRGFNCRRCHAVFTKHPQLANLFDQKAREQ
jgi:hypothetical protein